MSGKIAMVLLSGLLFGCVQTPPPAANAPPAPPPPPPTAAAPPPAAEAVPGDRIVSIRRVSCERMLELSAEDLAAASMFYIGYQASRLGARTINVSAIPTMRSLAADYCAAHPGRTAAEAFAVAYSSSRRRR